MRIIVTIFRTVYRDCLYSIEGSTVGTTIAGTGISGSSLSELNFPTAIFVDANRNMYIADGFNNRVLKWEIGAPMGVVVAGLGDPRTTLDAIASSYAIYVDAGSNIYVSECGNNRVTRWTKGNSTGGELVSILTFHQTNFHVIILYL